MAGNPATGPGSSEDSPLDVAVVGGGVSGAYTAWRLTTSDSDDYRSVALFEMSRRIGGRLLTLTPPGAPSLRAELGGMRFLGTHTLVAHIVSDVLRLETSTAAVGEPQNIAYLRDHPLYVKDLDVKQPEDFVLPYNVAEDERVSIGALMLSAISTVVARAVQDSQTVQRCLSEQGYKYEPGAKVDVAKLTRSQWQCIQKWGEWDGSPLRDWGFWNLLYRVMSPEAYSMVVDCSGYDTIVSNWNAADAMPWFLADFGDTVTHSHPDKGMDAIPLGLADRASQAGCSIHLNRELTSLDRSGELLRLDFSAQDEQAPPPVFARRVVLAMPRRSLERIGAGLALVLQAPGVPDMVEAVTPTALFKLFNLYESPWWEDLGPGRVKITKGRSVTSIPVRQVYYFGTEPTNKRSLLMMYNDDRFIKYWIGFLRDRSLGPRLMALSHSGEQGPFMGGNWDEYVAPEMMRKEAHRLVELMHGVTDIPEPIDSVFRDWSVDPYGGAYNMWKIHADSFAVSHNIVHPVESLPVYVCGEAYSHDQGWVQGALETAEDMLDRFFSLSPLLATD